MNEQKKDVIDLTEVWKLLKTKKKVFFIVLPIVPVYLSAATLLSL